MPPLPPSTPSFTPVVGSLGTLGAQPLQPKYEQDHLWDWERCIFTILTYCV
jgi:hypothetical protein